MWHHDSCHRHCHECHCTERIKSRSCEYYQCTANKQSFTCNRCDLAAAEKTQSIIPVPAAA